ncbi:MAG: hypothetical protein Q9187_002348 [Circinaria calcarea]
MRTPRGAERTIKWCRRLSKVLFTRQPLEAAPAPDKIHLDTSWVPQDNHLLSLPCELLLQIVNEVSPFDILSFSLSCKQIYNLAEDFAKEARECIPKYSRVPSDHDSSYNLDTASAYFLSLLNDLVRRPRIGLYITDFRILGSSLGSYLNNDIRGLLKAPSTVIETSLFINPSESQPWLDQLLTEEDPDLANALVLLFLPNVLHLTLSAFHTGWEGIAQRIAQVVHDIASMKHGRTSSQLLSKLASVKARWATDAGLDLVASFAALPSMREISVSGLRGDRGHFENWPFDHLSTVTTLRMDHCTFGMDQVAALLEGFSALRSFHYQTYSHGPPQHDINPRALCRTLVKRARRSLERLFIGVNYSWRVSSETPTFIGSLLEFQVLKYVGLETRFLSRFGITEKLVDMLPASLESLELLSALTSEAASAMLTDLPELKETRLPNLQEIKLQVAQLPKHIHASCSSIGVSITDARGSIMLE